MAYTVEDSLEILAGKVPRSVNIFLSQSDKSIVRSLADQISNNVGLTDRQLDLVLKKISKYRTGLIANGVDVDSIIEAKITRIPLREIDRSQTVACCADNRSRMFIKYNHSKDFFKIWELLKDELFGDIVERGPIKEFPFNETNVLATVDYLINERFEFSSEILEFYEIIKQIKSKPQEFLPYADFLDDKIILKNINQTCADYVKKNFSKFESDNFLAYVDRLKICGIKDKNQKILEKIENFSSSELTKKSLMSNATRFRIRPEDNSVEDVIKIINDLEQWPILVMTEDGERSVNQVITAVDALSAVVDKTSMTVFFRLDNNTESAVFFNQYIKENQLNGRIGKDTKVVFISKTRIPKPLIHADWFPHAAIVMASNDFGKSSAYLDGLPTVYYYNNAVSMRVNKAQGTRPIDEL